MKKILSAMLLAASALGAWAQQGYNRFYIEPRDFILADWIITRHQDQVVILTEKADSEPFVLVDVPAGKEGSYNVWAFSADFEKIYPATRTFKVSVNDELTEKNAGTHKKDGFDWQNLGKLDFKKGINKVSLKRTGYMPRCAALMFTPNDAFVPTTSNSSVGIRKKYRMPLIGVDNAIFESDFSVVAELKNIDGAKRIGIQNKSVRVLFTQKADAKGNKFFERSMEVAKDGKWIKLPNFKDELFFLGYESEDPKYDDIYFSQWRKNHGILKMKTPEGVIECNADAKYPYSPEEMNIMRPMEITKISDRSLKLDLGKGATAIVSLVEDTPFVKYEFSAPAAKEGWYTSGMTGFNKIDRVKVAATQMPPLFQLRNTMQTPKMLGNRFMSQPLSLVQINDDNTPYCFALIADPDKLPSEEWSSRRSSLYGFSLASPDNKVQTAVFYPVMGGRNSFKKAGEKVESSWYALACQSRWFEALALTNEKILPAGEFVRESYDTSFSDVAANLAAFLKNENASGWSRKYKGRWNIEDKTLVTHASPMTELEVAILTDDEEYYKNIALPTIEFTLTRASAHFAPRKERSPYSPTPYAMRIPSGMWKADYYAGVGKLLGNNANPWFDEFTKVDLEKMNMYSSQPAWTQLFGLWLANPSDELLKKTCDLVDKWLEGAFLRTSLAETDYSAFANVSFYPYWWYLPDLYEATKNPKYLDFARRGAFHTLAAQWAYPRPSKGEITINKGNIVSGIGHVWWRDAEKYRLGNDTQQAARSFIKDNPLLNAGVHSGKFIVAEKKIPDAKKVSRIGVGMEQPSTFRCGGDYNDFNILMPSWSAEMLKTFQFSGDEIVRKYSRHAIIGRYATFFGYYICDYTDLPHDPDYSIKGPDITSYYYHHAPCHFAQTFDYLMVQFEIASKGNVKFPYVRQQGYVWFTDRIFGQAGKIFGQDAKILLDKFAVRPSSPKVSTLGARGKDAIYVMLLNDSESAREVSLEFDAQAKLMQGAITDIPATLLDASGNEVGKLQFFGEKKIQMPAYGFFTVKIPAQTKEIDPKIPAISEGGHIVKAKASKTFNDMHAFRIRSPFGKDSLYVMMTGGVEKKGKLTVEMTSPSVQKIVCEEFPFEVSVYPLPMDKPIKFKATIQEEGQQPEILGEFELKQ